MAEIMDGKSLDLIGECGLKRLKLAGLIREHGQLVVWRASLARLGYPATWITDESEVLKIESFLKGE